MINLESAFKREVTLHVIFTDKKSDVGPRSPIMTGNGRALRRLDGTARRQRFARLFPPCRSNSTMGRVKSSSARPLTAALVSSLLVRNAPETSSYHFPLLFELICTHIVSTTLPRLRAIIVHCYLSLSARTLLALRSRDFELSFSTAISAYLHAHC